MQNIEFEAMIDEKIHTLLKTNRDFSSLVRNSKGIHPLEILKSIDRLKQAKRINHTLANLLISSAGSSPENIVLNNTVNYYPVPHMLDYDWRFSKDAITYLAQYIRSYIHSHIQGIVFMGTPSLFIYFANKWPHLCHYILLDKNANSFKNHIKTLEWVSFYECDITNVFDLSLIADIVVMDPPWYLDYSKMFISIGANFCHQGSIIMCVTPPFLTRPSANDEYDELIVYIKNLGLTVERCISTCINYSTPPFERNTLIANGIKCISNDWREGDLLILKKISDIQITKDIVTIVQNQPNWSEVSIGSVRIKFKNMSQDKMENFISLNRIYPNDIYPSVSRRFVGSERINVWTSGNTVFYCDNICLLDIIFRNWEHRSEITSLAYDTLGMEVDKEAIKQVIKLLEHIVVTETTEYGLWIQ
jgi:hypothetical protein